MVTLTTTTPRTKLPTINVWTLVTLIVVGVYLAPVVAVFYAAGGDSAGLWAHLFETVLPRYVSNTLVLMIGVGAVSLVFGISSAWVVFRYDFPARRYLEWMLLLPAAVPAYLVAYTYTDFLEYAGPVQGALRGLFGWQSARDYWFPEIRSMEGAILIMGAALYPYVYLMVRTAFTLTPMSFYETGMVAGRNLFWSVALPLARPATVAGLALVLMETVSDFGTVEYFAIETLTLGIFNVWLGMNSLPAASQIAVVAFLFIIALLVLEIAARSARKYVDTTRRPLPLVAKKLSGRAAVACIAVCLLPVTIGFSIPGGVLLCFVVRGQSLAFDTPVLAAAMNSLYLAGSVAVMVMAIAALMSLVAFYQGGPMMRRATTLASIGYAFPGTILAIGVVTAGGLFDAGIANVIETVLGVPSAGLVAGTTFLVIFACAVRFQAIGYGAVMSGLERLPPNLMSASRSLGRSFGNSLRVVIVPLLAKSIIAGSLLVFVDVMKELPMTLLLRPFNFETLSTYVYQFAKDELLEEAALPALFIIATGIIPVVVMNSALRHINR